MITLFYYKFVSFHMRSLPHSLSKLKNNASMQFMHIRACINVLIRVYTCFTLARKSHNHALPYPPARILKLRKRKPRKRKFVGVCHRPTTIL